MQRRDGCNVIFYCLKCARLPTLQTMKNRLGTYVGPFVRKDDLCCSAVIKFAKGKKTAAVAKKLMKNKLKLYRQAARKLNDLSAEEEKQLTDLHGVLDQVESRFKEISEAQEGENLTPKEVEMPSRLRSGMTARTAATRATGTRKTVDTRLIQGLFDCDCDGDGSGSDSGVGTNTIDGLFSVGSRSNRL